MEWRNEEFDLGGLNHLALVCSDMKRTVEFYTQVLGMRLIKTLVLPGTGPGASGNQKNARALPPPESKKKCWPARRASPHR